MRARGEDSRTPEAVAKSLGSERSLTVASLNLLSRSLRAYSLAFLSRRIRPLAFWTAEIAAGGCPCEKACLGTH